MLAAVAAVGGVALSALPAGAATSSNAGFIYGTDSWPFNVTGTVSQKPSGWCLTGASACATFFGGQTSSSKYALMWQWSGGGGYTNGYGDFDQIDVARMG